MTSQPLALFDFPLAELHVHLEGSARPVTLWDAGCSAEAKRCVGLRAWLEESSSDGADDSEAERLAGGTRLRKSSGEGQKGEHEVEEDDEIPRMFRARFPSAADFEAAVVLRERLHGGPDASGLTKCMAIFELTRVCLAVSPAVVERVATEMIEDKFRDGCRLVEMRYSPLFIQSANPAAFPDLAAVHDAVMAGIRTAREKFPIAIGLIGIIDRCWPLEDAQREAEFIFARQNDFVGIDLANDESRFPAAPFAPIFSKARSLGLGVTVHAAEVSRHSGFENIAVAVDQLGATRVGHGIGILSDPSGDTLRRVVAEKIMIECCPTSNVLVTDVASIEVHPIRDFLDRGANVSVSTDDPSLFGISLLSELRGLVARGVVTEDEVRDLNLAAVAASFIPQEEKRRFFPESSDFDKCAQRCDDTL
jgi:adenosine deaminase